MSKTASAAAMLRRFLSLTLAALLTCGFSSFAFAAPALASDVPKADTPNYRVAFYASANYNMQDESGVRSGYGYEMMQEIAKHAQCTFTYVGYDKTPDECVEMLRNGELDIYTAARATAERQEEFAISTHPAITSSTTMNVKVGNTKMVSGDYSTYEGIRVGLLRRHTYNNAFLDFAKQKGFTCEIVYYETPAELSNALVNDEVDALVNSYIRTPEDERTIENFGETPYYLMARQEDKALIEKIDAAIDAMNIETPNWRTDLYNQYYGAADKNTELTEAEEALLGQLWEEGSIIKAVMNPDGAPYSWYEDGQAKGIAADIFKACAETLGLEYEIIPVATREEYFEKIDSGEVDVWIDLGSEAESERATAYRVTDPYLTTTVSTVRNRDASGSIEKIVVLDNNPIYREIIEANWPDAEVIDASDTSECVKDVETGKADAALIATYSAQTLRKQNLNSALRVDIVPGASIDMRMGVNANDMRDFYGLWEKTLYDVANQQSAKTVQRYVEETSTPTLDEYLLSHPLLLVTVAALILLVVFLGVLYLLSSEAKSRQKQISSQLALALNEAKSAEGAKREFFSKMSHDIRTPLNVVLGMTQIARNCEDDREKLDHALESISSEGNYLLMLINSILDVNQLEHGHVELASEPFDPAAATRDSIELLLPLSKNKNQTLTVACEEGCTMVGDGARFEQIVLNIVSNAIKYTPDGGSIEVSLECFPTGLCRFTCTDNGIGMTSDFVAHITEDYVRAEDSRVSKVEGTGLGMSVVKGFTDLMGGTLAVESELGAGSTFTVEIPFVPQAQLPAKTKLEEEERQRFVTQLAGKKVLLAEDNKLNAQIAVELLGSIGLSVDCAEDGKAACRMFEASGIGEYCAIFMDMQMPVMDGLEATRRIRASKRSDADLPILAMTANTFSSDRSKCIDAGMTDFIPKPVWVDEIVKALSRTLR